MASWPNAGSGGNDEPIGKVRSQKALIHPGFHSDVWCQRLQAQLDKALAYQAQINDLAKTAANAKTQARLESIASQVNDWVAAIEDLARRLDDFQQNTLIRQDLEGVGLFAILGIGDRDANPVTWSIALGVGGRGSIPGRGADTWGVGYFYNDLQELRTIPVDALAGSVQGIEAYYNIAIAESVALTLDFQWADSAVRGIDDSIIPGLRLNLTF